MEEKDKQLPLENRESFSSTWGFILACIGSAVGMGNIWMFPYRMGALGGAAFLIPYIICVIVLGYTGVCEEICLGRKTRRGPIGAFGRAAESRGWNPKYARLLGYIPTLSALGVAIGYSVVMGWILKYLVMGAVGPAYHAQNTAAYFGASAGSFGSVGWQIGALVICFAVMVAGVSAGIERINKFMMPAFFLLFIVLAVRVAFLPGAGAGYAYMFKPVWADLAKPMTWVFAMGQAFFSLSLAGNGTVIYGSYFKDDEDVIKAARNVCVFDTIAAMLAALVILPACAALVGLKDLSSGPPLMFITLPKVFQSMPAGQIFMVVFFIAVLFAGMTSLVNLFETPIAALQENLGFSRAKAVAIIAVIGTAVGVCIEGIVSSWMDIVSIYAIPLGAWMAAMFFFWVFGPKKTHEELQKGRAKKVSMFLPYVGKYVFCILALVVFVLGIVFKGIG